MLADGGWWVLLGLLALAIAAVVAMGVWVSVLERRVTRVRRESRAQTMRLVSEITAGVAHTFNEVLTPIVGRAQLAAKRVADPQVRQWLGMIERSALDGAQMVTHIKEVTRLRRQDVVASVDLDVVAREARDAVATRFPPEVKVELRPGQPGPVAGDPVGLRDAVARLLANALEATPTGVITLATSKGEGEAVLTVTDTGRGIPAETRPRVLEPFFTTKADHAGLGLALVHGVVSRHGGQLEIESAPGTGTTVRLRLPSKADISGEVKDEPPAVTAPAGPPTCLLVDDDEHVRDMLHDVLTTGGYRVTTATDGSDGLEKFKQAAFELVITDFAMPRLNGLQLARACKRLRPAVPVLMLTGWEVTLSAKEFADQGVDGILAKPVKIDEILRTVTGLRPATDGDPAGHGPPSREMTV